MKVICINNDNKWNLEVGRVYNVIGIGDKSYSFENSG